MSSIQGTLAQWRDRLRRKELSSAELVNLTADAIEADRTTNAYISFDREAALRAAAAADISSPLAGIPIAVKDNINVLGQPTRCASRLLSPYVAPYDATSIRLLKALHRALDTLDVDALREAQARQDAVAAQRLVQDALLSCMGGQDR